MLFDVFEAIVALFFSTHQLCLHANMVVCGGRQFDNDFVDCLSSCVILNEMDVYAASSNE